MKQNSLSGSTDKPNDPVLSKLEEYRLNTSDEQKKIDLERLEKECPEPVDTCEIPLTKYELIDEIDGLESLGIFTSLEHMSHPNIPDKVLYQVKIIRLVQGSGSFQILLDRISDDKYELISSSIKYVKNKFLHETPSPSTEQEGKGYTIDNNEIRN